MATVSPEELVIFNGSPDQGDTGVGVGLGVGVGFVVGDFKKGRADDEVAVRRDEVADFPVVPVGLDVEVVN